MEISEITKMAAKALKMGNSCIGYDRGCDCCIFASLMTPKEVLALCRRAEQADSFLKTIKKNGRQEKAQRVPISECIARRLYKVGSRNLTWGVYNGKEGFIGIREKFRSKYLFTEFHWDQGPPYGTVHTVIDTGIDLPENIELLEYTTTAQTFSTYKPLFSWLEAKEAALGE